MMFLFIDDDKDDTDLFCEAVVYLNKSEFISTKKEHIKCLVSNNGCTAIGLLETLTELPDHIFLDINMPVMGGKECLTHLKSNPSFSKIPVTMLSTAFHANDASELKALGASECIIKPSGFKDLVKALSKYVYENYL
jgi:CheY-like chemotaxis protein